MDLKSVAVTGSQGLIGNEVVSTLNKNGYTTVGLDKSGRYRTSSETADAEEADEFYSVDLLDAGEVYGALARSGADGIVHLGTITNPVCNPGYVTYRSNVMTSYHVLEAAAELEMKSAVLPSSINVVGSGFQTDPMDVRYLPMNESHPLTPRDPYALGKHAMEVTADGIARLHGPLSTISSIRFPTVETDTGLRESFVRSDRSLSGIRNSDRPDRDVLFSYIHIDDATNLVRRALESDHQGHERFWAVADDTTAGVPNSKLIEQFYPDVEVRTQLDDYESLISNQKAKDLLDWAPQHSWREY